MEPKLENKYFETKPEIDQIIKEIFLELELPLEQEEIYDISTIKEEHERMLKDLLSLFYNLKNDKDDKIFLVEEIYVMFFNLGITLVTKYELIYNDPKIIELNQEVANLFLECYPNFKSFFAKYSSTCNWDEDAIIILQVRSGFEFLCEYFNHLNVETLKIKKLLNDLKSYEELSDFDYKIENWENCPIRLKDIPRDIPQNHFWWFPEAENAKVKAYDIIAKGSFLQIADIRKNKLFVDLEIFNNIIDKAGLRPLSIISVTGPTRNHKSFFINWILSYACYQPYFNEEVWFQEKCDKEFNWQNPTEKQITGIYMWSNPFFIRKNDREIAILLIDTRGSFDNKETTIENSIIFSLSCLLSSSVIYKISKDLSEDILRVLKFYIGFANLIEDAKKALVYTNLLFLIEDYKFSKTFEYGYYDESSSPSTINFMKVNLGLKPNMLPEFRIVREEIISNFQNIGSYLLPNPGAHLTNAKTGEKELFLNYAKEFVHRIFDVKYLTTKKIDGNEISGCQLKQYVEKWAKYFEENEIPEVRSNTDSNAEIQNQNALNISLKYYRSEIEKLLKDSEGLTNEYYEENHKKKRLEAIEIFKRLETFKNDEIGSRYLKQLEETIQLVFENYKLTNLPKIKFQMFKAESEKNKELFNKQFEKKAQESVVIQEQLILDLKKQVQESFERQKQIKWELERQARELYEIQQQIKKELLKQQQQSEELQKNLKKDLRKQKQESEEKQKQLQREILKKSSESEEIKQQLQKEIFNNFKKQTKEIEESKKILKHEIEKLSNEIEKNTMNKERNSFYYIAYIVISAIVGYSLGGSVGAAAWAFISIQAAKK